MTPSFTVSYSGTTTWTDFATNSNNVTLVWNSANFGVLFLMELMIMR